MAIHFSAIATYTFLCRVEQASNETPEALSQQPKLHAKTERAKEIAKAAFNTAIEKVKRGYPNCSVKKYLRRFNGCGHILINQLNQRNS